MVKTKQPARTFAAKCMSPVECKPVGVDGIRAADAAGEVVFEAAAALKPDSKQVCHVRRPELRPGRERLLASGFSTKEGQFGRSFIGLQVQA